jgi:2-polyprenyl-3-methyl-5-hydroxy-6-metoxy-1,4-benzoquinol methylase
MSNNEVNKRQINRYHPSFKDVYFELNKNISNKLDDLRLNFENINILDIGAGEVPFENFYKGLNVITCDIQQNSNGTIDHIIETSGRLPFLNEEFEAIFLFDVLEHIKNDHEFIKECFRILKPKGLIVANVPFMYRFHEEPHDYRRYTPSGIKYLLEEVGNFVIHQIEPIGSTLFIMEHIIAEKNFKTHGWRKFLHGLILRLLRILKKPNEISDNSPFSYFFTARK